MEFTVDPIVAAAIPIIIAVLRRLIPRVADSPYLSIGLAVALGALTSLASELGLPLEVGLMGGILSALTGIGGIEVAKLAPKVRSLNRSTPAPPKLK